MGVAFGGAGEERRPRSWFATAVHLRFRGEIENKGFTRKAHPIAATQHKAKGATIVYPTASLSFTMIGRPIVDSMKKKKQME
jgi:hypothetical protein